MDSIIASINMNMIYQNNMVNSAPSAAKVDPQIAAQELTSLFLKNMMKEIVKNESNSAMPEIFMDKIIEDITKSDTFGINKIFADQLRKGMK